MLLPCRFCVLIALALTLSDCSGAISVATAGQGSEPTSLTLSPITNLITELPLQADSLVDSIGVDTHFNYSQTPYVTNFGTVSQQLIASGIRHIRDGGVTGYGDRLTELDAAGIKHSLQFNVGIPASQITSDLQSQIPYVDFVEPQNEYDSTAATNPNWVSELTAEQSLIYSTVKSSILFTGVSVLGPALSDQNDYALLGSFSSIEDDGNLHDATCNLNPGTSNGSVGIAADTTKIRQSSMNNPIWTTETGYGDNASVQCAIPDSVIAKYDPRTIAERYNAGEPRTYFYQFSDDPTDSIFGAFGLIDSTGNAKPQYTAIKSMISLLSDAGAAFTPTLFSYQIVGGSGALHHTLLQKRDGTYILMLWIESPSFVASNGTNIGGAIVPVAPQTVTIQLAKLPKIATDYTYNATWNLVPTALPITGALTIPVTDSISFVEIK